MQKTFLVSLWTGLWSTGELGRGKKQKGLQTNIWDRRSMSPAVHQILMQAPIGENWLLTGLTDISFSVGT